MKENECFEKDDNLSQNVLKNTNFLIESKKLHINYLWNNRITQEDLNTPKHLDNNIQNLHLINFIFITALKFANKINEILESIIYLEDQFDEEIIVKVIMYTSCLIQKLKNFYAIKIKAFKKEKCLVEPLFKLQKYYGLFKLNLNQNEISIKVLEIYDYLTEFNKMLEMDGHLK